MKVHIYPAARAIGVAVFGFFSVQQVHAQGADATIFRRYQTVAPIVEEASNDVQAHRFDEAKKALEPVLKLVPNHATAHFLLAWMAYANHDFSDALTHIETSEHSLMDLSLCYAKIKSDEAAKDEKEAREIQNSIDQLKSAINSSEEAEATGASDLLGAKAQHLENLESKKTFHDGASFEVPASYSFLHGNCLYRLGRPEEAAAQYRLAIRTNPSYAKAWNNLISLYWGAKDFTSARATLAKAEAAGVVVQPKLKQSVLEAK